MNDPDIDPSLLATAQRIAELARRVDLDPQHQTRLREELLRRHQERPVINTRRAMGSLWPRFPRFKRLTLVAPAALAAAVFSLLLWVAQLSGHPTAQTAEAEPIQRLSRALAQTVPTLTSWSVRVTTYQVLDDAASTDGCAVPLKPDERLYIRDDRAYFYSNGQWYRVTSSQATAKCRLPDWQWAFVELPARLAHHALIIHLDKPVDGRPTERISYSSYGPPGTRVVTSVVVEQQSGLVRRIERVTVVRGRVTERTSADYSYGRQS